MRRPDATHSWRIPVPWAGVLFCSIWLWAIWSCAEHWRGNPNYSYGWAVPLLALAFGLRRAWNWSGEPDRPLHASVECSSRSIWALAGVGGALVCALEFARQDMWHPQIVLELICAIAVAGSLATFARFGGRALLRAEVFPVVFFLTAVPWPPRLEQPVTGTLMRVVAGATAETLHWLGIEAQTSGGAIALSEGLVGITEACSGIRSLQAGIMFGLALGEWFLLRPLRRVVLLGLAIVLALATNLARTLALSLQAEWHGLESVEKVHDLIGNVTITTLIAAVWIGAKLLAPRTEPLPLLPWQTVKTRVRELGLKLACQRGRRVASLVIFGLVGFVAARAAYGVLEARAQTQTVPFFSSRPSNAAGDQVVAVPKEIWSELRPTVGEYIHRQSSELPRGVADFYHFFWKPSPWNRFVLVHRPDICMPGVGWQAVGAPEPVDVDFEGNAVRCYAFRFERGQYRALQLWGVWRNGDPVPLEYKPAQVLGDAVPPPGLSLEGKRRSATEIIACTLISDEAPPRLEIAVALLPSLFQYLKR